MKELIINCDNIDSIPSELVNMTTSNEIEVLTWYTIKTFNLFGF